MKRLFIIAAIAFITGSASVYAGNYRIADKNTEIAKQENKKKVNEADLPEGVKRVLKNDTYKDWKLDQAYLMQEGDYYKIELKRKMIKSRP